MKKSYELGVVLRLDANEEAMNESLSQIKGWVEANDNGTVTKIDRWGRRRLAYEIDKQREGYYVFYYADIDAGNLPELERNLRLSPSVLRYLLVRQE
jgi:small subunit ribosomal protein S6